MSKVRCKFCQFELEGKCVKKKNSTIRLNKKRVCSQYKPDIEKVDNFFDRREEIPSQLRPDWWWDKEKKRKVKKRFNEKTLEQYQTTLKETPSVSNIQHPLTGDLNKFMQSTVNDK